MRLYTLTLNPAYDVHAYIDTFAPYHENLAELQSKIAGGKGVNISRALKNASVEHTAIVVLGTDNGAEFRAELESCGVTCIYLQQPGRIRENLTFHCGNAPETRISFSGFRVDKDLLDRVESQIEIDDDTYITYTGRNPSGISTDEAIAFLGRLQDKGAKIILDSKSFDLDQILAVRPWLIKPNQEEISELFDCEITSFEECLEKANIFSANGVENVMVSLGEKGALLISNGKTYIATPPAIDAISTIGAGDSSIAGFLEATYHGLAPELRLATAVSFGSAACMTEGTEPPVYSQIQEILKNIKLHAV